MPSCSHTSLRFDSNEWKPDGYQPPAEQSILEALHVSERLSKKQKKSTSSTASSSKSQAFNIPSEQTFPAPLVERDDELYHDPESSPQSVQDWIDGETRNKVTRSRRTIYVARPPEIADEVDFMHGWMSPQESASKTHKGKAAASPSSDDVSAGFEDTAQPPNAESIVGYLQAFYHGLPVKVLGSEDLRFAAWNEDSETRKSRRRPKHVALSVGDEAIRIRCRPCPDKTFKGQLNLDDLLDAAISMLPMDAYALLMLFHHDLYEDEDDDFCCGRAYGGSRIAVVSSARYRPELDVKQRINRDHSWPASHCRMPLSKSSKRPPSARDRTVSDIYPGSAIAAGINAFKATSPPNTVAELSALWLGRVCKTASHELGHCFGIGHCSYYACIMQGTASLPEDTRQPPYLCPVDLVKVLRATGSTEGEHYGAMLDFCETQASDKMFAALAAWIRVRLSQRAICL